MSGVGGVSVTVATPAPLRVVAADGSIAGALAGEIERVAILRERHRRLGEDLGNEAGFAAAVAMLTFTIDAAKRAIGDGDLIAMIAAYQMLRGFDDE